MIGQHVARFVGDHRITQAHLVESEVAERVVLRCGKQMTLVTARGEIRPFEGDAMSTCGQCSNRRFA